MFLECRELDKQSQRTSQVLLDDQVLLPADLVTAVSTGTIRATKPLPYSRLQADLAGPFLPSPAGREPRARSERPLAVFISAGKLCMF